MLITRVGFGAWAIGGAGWAHAWGGQDDAESVTAIQHAVRSGINWIDTAAVYGLGHSEKVVARALLDVPVTEHPNVFTKGGTVWDNANPAPEPRRIGRLTPLPSWRLPSGWGTSTPSNHPSPRFAATSPVPSCRGRMRTTPALLCTARCSRAC